MRFWIQIDQVEVASFTECSEIAAETEFEEIREGGVNDRVHRLPIRTLYRNLTLRRGVDQDKALYL